MTCQAQPVLWFFRSKNDAPQSIKKFFLTKKELYRLILCHRVEDVPRNRKLKKHQDVYANLPKIYSSVRPERVLFCSLRSIAKR
jgi:hypothetical protein